MSEEEVKMTGLYWLDKGTLGKDIRQGDPIPVGYVSDALIEKFKKEGKIGEKITVAKSDQAVVLLKEQIKTLKEELKQAQKPQTAGNESDKVKSLQSKLEEVENQNGDLVAENEALKSAISKVAEEIPDLEQKIHDAIESGSDNESVLGKIGGWFKKDK